MRRAAASVAKSDEAVIVVKGRVVSFSMTRFVAALAATVAMKYTTADRSRLVRYMMVRIIHFLVSAVAVAAGYTMAGPIRLVKQLVTVEMMYTMAHLIRLLHWNKFHLCSRLFQFRDIATDKGYPLYHQKNQNAQLQAL